MDRLLSLDETAGILGIKKKTLYQWKWRGKYLSFVKVGKGLRVSEDDLKRFIEGHKSRRGG